MANVAGAEEGHPGFQLAEQPEQLLRQGVDRLLVPGSVLFALLHQKPVLRVKVAPPKDVIPKRFQQQALENVGVFALWAEKNRPQIRGVHGIHRLRNFA